MVVLYLPIWHLVEPKLVQYFGFKSRQLPEVATLGAAVLAADFAGAPMGAPGDVDVTQNPQ